MYSSLDALAESKARRVNLFKRREYLNTTYDVRLVALCVEGMQETLRPLQNDCQIWFPFSQSLIPTYVWHTI